MEPRTNNPNGRPKGKPNKITGDLREQLAGFLKKQWPVFVKDFGNLTPRERVRLFEKLLSYAIPKLQTIEYRTEDEQLLDRVSDEQIEYLYTTIIENQLLYENDRTETSRTISLIEAGNKPSGTDVAISQSDDYSRAPGGA